MAGLALNRRDTARIVLAAVGGVSLLAAARLKSVEKNNGAERLAEALLDTEKLRDATLKTQEQTEAALAACAAYLLGAAYRASSELSHLARQDDPAGYSRTHTHPYTKATSTVLTEGNGAQAVHSYSVTIPEVGEVRGTRRFSSLRMSGFSPASVAPEAAQVTLGDYTALCNSDFEITEYALFGRARLYGKTNLRDNRGNVGLVNIGYDGTVNGTITRENRVVGRFSGNIAKAIEFKQYQIESSKDE